MSRLLPVHVTACSSPGHTAAKHLVKENQPHILVFTDQLLPISNTFIRSQMESLRRFEPYYVGLKYNNDIALNSKRTYVLNSGTTVGALRSAMFKLIPYSPSIYHYAKQISPRLIHAHFGPNGALCLNLRQRLQVPLIVTFHGYDATMSNSFAGKFFLSYRMYLRRKQSLIQQGDLFIAVSHFIQGKLVEQGFPIERTRVHYIGIDTDFLCPDPHIPREPVVLFVARLMEKKGSKDMAGHV